MTNEQIISDFMQKHYTDERLAALLAHAEDGKLAFVSCCCFAGIPTANHALRGENLSPSWLYDYEMEHAEPKDYPWFGMSDSFAALGVYDTERRAKLIPLIKAEVRRRGALQSQESISIPALAT